MRETPLVRDLKLCSKSDYLEGVKELLTVVAFAFLPVWLGFVFSVSSAYGSSEEFLLEFIKSGEALLVAAALVGPLIYIITRKYGEFPQSLTIHFPQGWLFTVLLVLVCVTSSAIFGAKKGYKILDPASNIHAAADNASGGFLAISLIVVVASMLIFYFVSVFRNYTDRGAANMMRASQSDFLSEWERS